MKRVLILTSLFLMLGLLLVNAADNRYVLMFSDDTRQFFFDKDTLTQEKLGKSTIKEAHHYA